MKLKVGIVIPFIIGFLTLLTSCAKDTEIIIHEVSKQSSVITSDLIVTTLEASAFIDKSSQQERVMRVDTTNIDLITTDFFKESPFCQVTRNSLKKVMALWNYDPLLLTFLIYRNSFFLLI